MANGMEESIDTRIALLTRRMERLEKHYDEHAKILFNGGQGIMFKLDRLDQRTKAKHYSIGTAVNIMMLIANIVMAVITYLK
jgi:hypothetical protein